MSAKSTKCPGCGAPSRFGRFIRCTKCGREGCNDCMAYGTPQLCLECSPSKFNIAGAIHESDDSIPYAPAVGVAVNCVVCGLRKKPRGRDAPLAMANGLCDHECPGYDRDPEPHDLWPGETREEFGY